MAELELVRAHTDGGHLVLRAPDGAEHDLPVTDELRAAVRRTPRVRTQADGGRTSTPMAGTEPTLRPRDLQVRLRAGATVEELAAEANLPVEHVRRYEWPVATERDHVIRMVRSHQVHGVAGAAVLGEITDARLAARGVTTRDATWSARREGSAPWVVEVRFAAGDRERSARWTFDVHSRVVTPLDDEARWLGQPDDPLTPERRSGSTRSGRRGSPPTDGSGSAQDSAPERSRMWDGGDETDLLLDDLAGRRGHRPLARTRQRPQVPAPTGAPPAGDDAGFDSLPQGDGPPAKQTSATEPAAQDDGTGASVVELGRWNPRRERAATSDARPRATQPALLPLPGSTAQTESTADPETGKPNPKKPARRGRGAPPASRPTADGGATEQDDAPVAVRSSPESNPGSGPAKSGPAARRSGRKGRAQVPSWDEIVFGARPDA